MAERFNVPPWKGGVRETVPGVQISLSPLSTVSFKSCRFRNERSELTSLVLCDISMTGSKRELTHVVPHYVPAVPCLRCTFNDCSRNCNGPEVSLPQQQQLQSGSCAVCLLYRRHLHRPAVATVPVCAGIVDFALCTRHPYWFLGTSRAKKEHSRQIIACGKNGVALVHLGLAEHFREALTLYLIQASKCI